MAAPLSRSGSLYRDRAAARPSTSTSTPPTPRPGGELVDWDESAVADFLASVGYPYYEAQLKEHGITGDILVHLDHEALKDIGIRSVGQRLAILKAVYDLKVAQNVPVEEGHYVPPSSDMDAAEHEGAFMAPAQMVDMIHARDDRIRNLETEVQRLHEAVLGLRDDGSLSRGLSSRARTKSPTTAIFPHPLSQSSNLHPHSNGPPSAGATLTRKDSRLRMNGSTVELSSSLLPDSPHSPMDSPRLPQEQSDGVEVLSRSQSSAALSSLAAGAPAQSHASDMSVALTPTTPTARHAQSASVSAPSSSANGGLSLSAPASSSAAKSADPGGAAKGNKSSPDGTSTARFRVTLEDPCWKVLPAALKKYRINEDWRQYALFICYGTTERCLAYDEKPLLLFQRLKDGGQNPIFNLRHLRDIKSPIAVAALKHEARRAKRSANAGVGLDKPPSQSRDGSTFTRATRLHHPPVLLPVGRDRDRERSRDDGEDLAPPVSPSPREAFSFCVAIYPYLAEGPDEFDVDIGDTFVVIAKAKGWWVVHRDSGSSSDHHRKSAWVPAGCLLETNVSVLSLPGAQGRNASKAPISPSNILSVSTAGVVLMDYSQSGADELEARKGTLVRVFKRYNHWSYAVKDDGSRGWLPSFFVGKAKNASSSSEAAPPATAPALSRTGSISVAQGRSRNEAMTAEAQRL